MSRLGLIELAVGTAYTVIFEFPYLFLFRGGGTSLNLGGPLLNFHILQCSLGGASRHLARTHSQVHFGLAI